MSDASRVELLVLDVDGIFTDGGLYIGSDGTHFKKYNTRDGMGVRLFHEAGLRIGIISGHATESTVRRFSRLGVEDIHVGVEEKGAVIRSLMEKYGLEREQTAAMGDDVMDLPMLEEAGFSVTVPEGHESVKKVASYVTTAPGGQGAVREVIEIILTARGLLEGVLARYRS